MGVYKVSLAQKPPCLRNRLKIVQQSMTSRSRSERVDVSQSTSDIMADLCMKFHQPA